MINDHSLSRKKRERNGIYNFCEIALVTQTHAQCNILISKRHYSQRATNLFIENQEVVPLVDLNLFKLCIQIAAKEADD